MPHETALIATLAVGLALAFVGAFVAVRLRLSDRRVLVHPQRPQRQSGAVTARRYHLILAGALLSIILNPFIFNLVTRLPDRRALRPDGRRT